MHALVEDYLAFGKHHAGAIEDVMRTFQEGVKRFEGDIESAAREIVCESLECGEKDTRIWPQIP